MLTHCPVSQVISSWMQSWIHACTLCKVLSTFTVNHMIFLSGHICWRTLVLGPTNSILCWRGYRFSQKTFKTGIWHGIWEKLHTSCLVGQHFQQKRTIVDWSLTFYLLQITGRSSCATCPFLWKYYKVYIQCCILKRKSLK